MKKITDYPVVDYLEKINILSRDKIDFAEIIYAEKTFKEHLAILGVDSDKFENIDDNKICIDEDLKKYGIACRSEGFLNGYITALKVIKGEIL